MAPRLSGCSVIIITVMRRLITTIAVVLVLLLLGFWFERPLQAKLTPRNYFTGVTQIVLPPDATLLRNENDSNEHLMVWRVSPSFLNTLKAPPPGTQPDSHPSVQNPSSWAPSPLEFMGTLERNEYPAAEFVFYKTNFYSIALGRDMTQGLLIASMLDTN